VRTVPVDGDVPLAETTTYAPTPAPASRMSRSPFTTPRRRRDAAAGNLLVIALMLVLSSVRP
jgi:hypothetical protein